MYDCCEDLITSINEKTNEMFSQAGESSDGMQVMHSSRGMWVSMVTQDAIVYGLVQVRYMIVIGNSNMTSVVTGRLSG